MSKLLNDILKLKCGQYEERYHIPCNDITKKHIQKTIEEAFKLNKELKKKSAQEIADLSPWELFPSSWTYILNKAKMKEDMEEKRASEEKRENGEKCPGCGKNTLKVVKVKQMRSADEDDTKARLCKECGYNDRQS